MPAKDIYHDSVRNALIKDGWTITQDPLKLKVGRKKVYVDLGAERLLCAEKGTEKIALEIKSFIGLSDVTDLEHALGQYVLYEKILAKQQPDRCLYLAVNEPAFNGIFSDELGQILLADETLRLVVFDENEEVIVQWIPQ